MSAGYCGPDSSARQDVPGEREGSEITMRDPKEAAKLGFEAACSPRRLARGNRATAVPDGLRLNEMGHLSDLVAQFTGKPAPS